MQSHFNHHFGHLGHFGERGEIMKKCCFIHRHRLTQKKYQNSTFNVSEMDYFCSLLPIFSRSKRNHKTLLHLTTFIWDNAISVQPISIISDKNLPLDNFASSQLYFPSNLFSRNLITIMCTSYIHDSVAIMIIFSTFYAQGLEKIIAESMFLLNYLE